MRRLLTALASLAVLALIIPSVGLAIEPPVDNGTDAVLCIFSSEDIPSANNVINPLPLNAPQTIYFVLYYPRVSSGIIGGFEFSWSFAPAPAVAPFVLGATYPAGTGALNIGDNYNQIVGFGNGLPFNGEDHKTIVTFQLLFSADPGVTEIFLGPATPASLPGEIAYNDRANPGDIRPMRPNSVDGLLANPVFGFNEEVATEPATWGSVKALFQ